MDLSSRTSSTGRFLLWLTETSHPLRHLDHQRADHNTPALQAGEPLQSLADCFHLTLGQLLAALIVVTQFPHDRMRFQLAGQGCAKLINIPIASSAAQIRQAGLGLALETVPDLLLVGGIATGFF